MRPSEFSNEDIVKAGNELKATGRNVTGFALRKLVGGGAAPRLKQVWDEHLNSHSVAGSELKAELPVEVEEQLKVVSDALVERLRLLAEDLNNHAVRSSERRVSEVVRSAGEQRTQAERELADASMTVDDLEAKLDSESEETNSLRSKLAEISAFSQQQAVELAQLKERLLAAEAAAKQAQDRYEIEHAQASQSRDNASRLEGQVQTLEKLLAAK